MTNEKLNEILEYLGTNGFDEDNTTEFTFENFSGTINYSEYDYDSEDDEMSAACTLIINDNEYEFTRTGYKNFSYGNWVETSWYDWEAE